MDHSTQTYEDHTRAARKKTLILLVSLIVVVAVLGSVFLFVAYQYAKTDYSLILKSSDALFCVDGFLFPKADATGLPAYFASYNLNSGMLRKYSVSAFHLSNYGLEGSYPYFLYRPSDAEDAKDARIVPAIPELIPLSRANTDKLFVHTTKTGEKYLLSDAVKTASPLFANSTAQGVDPYGRDVKEFSFGGRYALGLDGDIVHLYVRERTTDFGIQAMHTLDFSEHGTITDAFFCSQYHVQIVCTNDKNEVSYFVCDARSGEKSSCPRPEGKVYSDTPAKTAYAQLFLTEEQNGATEDHFPFTYINATLGNELLHKLPPETNGAFLTAVSPSGEYALIQTQSESGEAYLFSRAEKKQVSPPSPETLSLNEGETLLPQRTLFLADNIVLLTVNDAGGRETSLIVKLCF